MLKFTEAGHIDPELLMNPFWVESLSQVSPEHTHDFYEFFIIREGTCRHVANGQTQLLKPGCLVFMRPSDIHKYERLGDEDCRFLNIACRYKAVEQALAYLDEPAFKEGLLSGAEPPVALLSQLEMLDVVRHFERFLLLATLDKIKARLYAKGLLTDILTQYFLKPDNVEKPDIPLWLEQTLSQMQLKENLLGGLQALYRLSGRSVGHVNRAFRQYLQQTPTEYVNQLKLNIARNLLLTTEWKVVDIALESGFDNVSHFYHQFKKFYHQAPLDFRRNAAK
ncbi:helix-turn-helix domain-containing protein [Paenibacillus physcomitrellae]|uniref:Transcriptional regulator ChbR n=1 Tax=Paenibacillus physcomitrellae TaxID=1619311 RepID=A0ABQ1FPE7_9BACL|nr:helix-turn-helix domain-containing protein [Paenibacillus physcomitrellae]GGA22093.1 transcriptional regulator ChbR [Paenibacillus physcomitrellae]